MHAPLSANKILKIARLESLDTAFHTLLWPKATASHGFLRKIFPVFSIHLARPGKNAPNGYAILIAGNQSNDKRSCANQRKGELGFARAKNPKTLQFSAENCNRRSQLLKQHDLHVISKSLPRRPESSFNVHSTPKTTPAAAKRPPCRDQRKSGPAAGLVKRENDIRGRKCFTLEGRRASARASVRGRSSVVLAQTARRVGGR